MTYNVLVYEVVQDFYQQYGRYLLVYGASTRALAGWLPPWPEPAC